MYPDAFVTMSNRSDRRLGIWNVSIVVTNDRVFVYNECKYQGFFLSFMRGSNKSKLSVEMHPFNTIKEHSFKSYFIKKI